MELCDACQPIECPPNMIPVDTDNDGCDDACELTTVCCQQDDGTFAHASIDTCGNPAPEEMCDEVCCQTPAGYQYVPAGQCGLAVAADSYCHPTQEVCCETANGYLVTPSDICPDAQVAMSYCSQQVCCQLADGTISYLPTSECFSALPDDACNGAPAP